MRKSLFLVMLLTFATACLSPAGLAAEATGVASPPALDPNLPYYRPVPDLKGELKLGGSNTLSHIAAVWLDGFAQFYPDVKASIEVNGSRQAVEDVKTGATNLGLLSRTIRREEVDDFVKTFGYGPTVLTPCLERTGIFVHKSNPIEGLTLAQLDAIYSEDCRRGAEKPCRAWSQLGLSGGWSGRNVVAHGRSKDTGSQVFIQEAVMLGGAMRKDLKTHASNVDMLKAVAKDPSAIGFSGLSYATSDVKAVPLSFGEGEPFVAIDSPEADRGRYPLVRRLQLVVKHDPKKSLRPVEREFVKYVFSRLGQEDVIKAGFQAIPARPARLALDAVGLGISR